MRIAIDGPSGAGKSTAARLLAQRLHATYIDTGAMYRAVALAVMRAGGRADDEAAAGEAVARAEITLAHDAVTGAQRIFLDGEDVSEAIRAHEMSAGASDVSKHAAVRRRMVELQRQAALGADVVMDGRDIGTVVFPDAEHKFYLTAPPEVRARRRHAELAAKGGGVSFEDCLRDLVARDENDSTRALAPLRPAEDAAVIDTGEMTADQVADELCARVAARPSGGGMRPSGTGPRPMGGEPLGGGARPRGGEPTGGGARQRRGEPPGGGRGPLVMGGWVFRALRVVAIIWSTVFYRFRVLGADRVPETGPVLLCSNHVCRKDMVFIGSRVKRRVRWIAKSELFRNPAFAAFITFLGAFPVRRGAGDRGAIKSVYAVLGAGEALGLFPEGHRIRDAKDRPAAKRGFVSFALNAGAPIVPVSLRYGDGPFGFCRLFSPVTLEFGEPVALDAARSYSHQELRDIGKAVMQSIYARVDGMVV